MNKNYVKHIVVVELIKAHDAGILLANGGGVASTPTPAFFLRRTRPLQVSSCRELDVVFESGGGGCCAPPNPLAVFSSSAGLLSRTSHHQEELRQAHACIILPASKDRTHQGV